MRPPYLGLRMSPFAYRWTGDTPDPAYVARLARACASAKTAKEKSLAQRIVWEDVTGWAFTRYMYETQLECTGWTSLRKQRVAALLDTLPPWPFDVTPSGWDRDGFPKELF